MFTIILAFILLSLVLINYLLFLDIKSIQYKIKKLEKKYKEIIMKKENIDLNIYKKRNIKCGNKNCDNYQKNYKNNCMCNKITDYNFCGYIPSTNKCIYAIGTDPTEAPKHDSIEDKPDLSLIPYDLINELLLPCYEEGLNEYYRDSWRMGFPVMQIFSATLRHLFKFIFKHEDYDKESWKKYKIKKHHLGAAIANCLFIYNSLKINPEKFDDRR